MTEVKNYMTKMIPSERKQFVENWDRATERVKKYAKKRNIDLSKIPITWTPK